MRYFKQQNALLLLVALTAMLFGPRVQSACAQPESLADWPAKAQAKGFAGPLPVNKGFRFSNFNQMLRNKGQWVDAADPTINSLPHFTRSGYSHISPIPKHAASEKT